MAKGFIKDNKFRPTGGNGRKSSRIKTTSTGGIEPREPFALRERVRLSNEEQLSRDFTFDELDLAKVQVVDLLESRFFDLNPEEDFFSQTVAFDYAEKQGTFLDPDFDVLITELKKINGAINQKTMRSLS